MSSIPLETSKSQHLTTWNGYKLHIATADGDVPLACLLTSADLHDSQATIPLMETTARRATTLYDLMDAAYDAPQIWARSEALGHVPIIDRNPRRGGKDGAQIEPHPPEHRRLRARRGDACASAAPRSGSIRL